jgi:hypothetical protein
MKIVVAIFLLVFSMQLFANEVRVEINPSKPVAGDVFQAYFRIFTDSEDEPSVNFSPTNLEVVDKSNQGVSTRTVYANGRLTVTREVTIVYNLVSSRPGTSWIRDIQVQIGGKTIRHPSITINVLKEPEVAADVFVMAEVPKKTLFIGEGITVRYFLYSKVPVQNLDVKKYPKLNNFLKRFIQEPERTERVSVDGQGYLRSQIYAAKLFPEKAGQLKIDSLSLSATYPVSRAGDPFGAFGMSRELKTRTLNSESITVQVNALPQPVPSHFTGLVGKHEFELDVGQSRLIVNEPLTVKLTVTGSGALENFEAPDIIKHPGLEEFESNGDLKIADATEATKIFDYTFLPKENLKLPASQVTFSFLDPETASYVPKTLPVPEIVIAGGSGVPKSDKDTERREEKRQDSSKLAPEKSQTISGPLLKEIPPISTLFPYINATLAFLSLLIALSLVVKFKGFPALGTKYHIPAGFKKGEFEFGEFARWLSPLINKTGKSPSSLIREAELDVETKNYFLQLLELSGKGQYSSSKAAGSYQYNHDHFKKLSRYIASSSDENPDQSS